MEENVVGRKERRRRKPGAKAEGNLPSGTEFEKTIENAQPSTGPHVTHSFGKLLRRDTYSILRSKSYFGFTGNAEDAVKNPGSSADDSADSRNRTYSLSNDSEKFIQRTYNIDEHPESKEFRPVPAPRKRKFESSEEGKVSSDTDRDVTEIDLDDPKSPRSPGSLSDMSSRQPLTTKRLPNGHLKSGGEDKLLAPPIPKPRKTTKDTQKSEWNSEKTRNEVLTTPELESLEGKTTKSEDKVKSDADSPTRAEPIELPLVVDLQDEAKSEDTKPKSKKQRKLIGDLLDRKGKKKKSRTLSALMKLEKKKIPKISILRDLKEENEKSKADLEEDKLEFQIPYTESAENGQIYVQGKSGFHVRERDEVLRNGSGDSGKDGSDGMTVDSTVKTAILMQKFWSRVMTYFHGVLAGFGFSHAATVTAIMIHYNYEPQEFIGVYSCLSLKIHYAFYTLTVLCIVSCFDRIDVGHMNRKHWDAAWKAPSTWIVLVVYAVGFALTLANQMTEARFDALPTGNETEIWNDHDRNKIQVHLLQWYHGVWARDVLVLFAWLVIALTKSEDLLLCHISNMAKYAESRGEEKGLRQRTEFM